MKIPPALVLAIVITAGAASAQTVPSPPANELLLLAQNSSFTDPNRTDHRIFSAEYYATVNPDLKLFGTVTLSRRFDVNDRSAGLGAYFRPAMGQMLYGNLVFGFSPTVIPGTDLSLEYTHTLADRFDGIIGYRLARFTGETVHMLIPGMTLYQLTRWTFTPKVFLARLTSDPAVRATFFLHVTYDLSESLMPELYYAVGSETYRVETIDYLAALHSWGITAGARIQISERLRLRTHYRHIVRPGAFEENGVDVAVSIFW